MLRGYRGIIVAVAGLILIGSAQPPKQTAGAQKTERPSEAGKGAPNRARATTEPAKAVQPAKNEQPCGPHRYRGYDDLCAQWKAADSADQAAQWAWWQLWLSGLGVFGLGMTLWFNFRALRLAEKSAAETAGALEIARQNAQSAGEANKIAREGMEKQLRAYVVVSYVEIFSDKAKPGYIQIAAHFQNVGETPATDLTAGIFGRVLHGTQFRCDRTRGETSGGRSNLVLAKGSKPSVVSHSVELFNGLTASDVINGDYSSFAFGLITYADVFGQRHETTFCFVTNPESRKTAISVIAAEDGNHCG